MSNAHTNRAATIVTLQLGLCLFTAPISTVSLAGQFDNEWRIEPVLSIKGVSNAYVDKGILTTYETASAMLEWRISSPAKPYYVSFFSEYNYSTLVQISGSVNLGGFFKYSLGAWDTTGFLFVNRSSGGKNTWFYAGRIRYRLDDYRKVGIEIVDAIGKPDSPTIALGYYRSLSKSLSLNVMTGTGIGEDSAASARIELSWSL